MVKKILALVVMIVFVTVCVGVVGEEATKNRKAYYQEVSDDTLGCIEGLIEIYEEYPEYFGKDYIYLSYGYLKTFYGLQSLLAAEGAKLSYETQEMLGRQDLTSEAVQMSMQVQSVMTLLEKDINEHFYAWVNEGASDEETAAFMVKNLRSVYETYGKNE